jgi:iron complex outermembrane receptor protein
MNKIQTLLTKTLLLAAPAIPFTQSLAQEASTDNREEVFEMDPFTVNTDGDIGYLSGNAFSAYRLNTPISELPFNIQIIGDEFIDDLEAVNLEDVIRYSSAVSLNQTNTAYPETGNFNIRGLSSGRPKRNGITRYLVHDTTNIARIEIVKGPASTTYGSAEPGGVVNYITKQASNTASGDFSLSLGTWGYSRAQLGLTGPIMGSDEKLLYRIDASYLDRGGYRDWEDEERAFFSSVLEWHATDTVTLRVDLEILDQTFNIIAPNFVWSPEAYEEWLALPDGDGPGEQFNSAVLRSVPSNRRWTEIVDYLPYTLNSAGPESKHDTDAYVVTGELNWKIADWVSFRGVAVHTDVDMEQDRASANRFRVTGDGVSRSSNYRMSENVITQYQGDFVFNLEAGDFKHRGLAGVSYEIDKFENLTSRDERSQFLYFNPASVGILPQGVANDVDILNYRLAPTGFRESAFADEKNRTGLYASYQLSAMDGKLNVMTGVRRDSDKQLDADGNQTRDTIKQTSYQFGVNYKVTDTITLFGNYSESFVPVGGLFRRGFEGITSEDQIVEEARLPQVGEGYDIGIKIMSPDNKIAGTISYFDIARTNTVTNVSIFPDGPSEPSTAFNINRYYDGEEASGFEVSLIYTPVKHWQTIFNFAYIDAVINDPNIAEADLPYARDVSGVPENQFSIWTKYTIESVGEGLELGLGFIWVDERRGNDNLNDFITLDSYDRWDLFVKYNFKLREKDAYVKLNIENVADEVYFRPGPYIQDPVNGLLTFGIDF